jgi:DNA polymerase-3 subunit delta
MTRATAIDGLRPHALRRALGAQPPGPLYFCPGEEPYVTTQVIGLLRAAALGPEELFNYDRFDAAETPVDEIITAAMTLPAFAARRLVIVTGAEALDADEQESLAAYVDNPSPTTCLVVTAAKADQRRRLFALLSQRAVVVNCQPLLERELPVWLNGQAAAIGVQLAPEVAHALLEQAGGSLHTLTNELEKLQTIGTSITLDDLAQLTVHGRTHSVFELTDAAGERRLADALTIVRRLLVQGEQSVGLVAMLTRHLRRLWRAKCAIAGGETPSGLSRRLGVMPRYADTLGRQAKGFTTPELQQALAQCLAADAQLKGGRLPKEQVIEWLLIGICQRAAGPLLTVPG